MTRVPLSRPFTPMEELVVELLARGKTFPEIAESLGIKQVTAYLHATNAAMKIPGGLARKSRILAWHRGASLEVLTGGTLSR